MQAESYSVRFETGARGWYEKLVQVLDELDLLPIQSDQAVFYGTRNGIDIFILVYVDDMLIMSTNPVFATMVKTALGNAFVVKDLGPASDFVGITLFYSKDGRTLKLTQESAIERALVKIGMEGCKPLSLLWKEAS